MLHNSEITPYTLFGKHLSYAGSDVGISPLTRCPLLGPVVSCVCLSLHLQPNLLLEFQTIVSYRLMFSDVSLLWEPETLMSLEHICVKRDRE